MTTSTTIGQRTFMRGHVAGGHFSLENLNVTLDCSCSRPIGKPVDSMRENPDIVRSKVPFSMGEVDPYLVHSSLSSGTPEYTLQTVSRSVQLFWQGSSWLQTERPTDHVTPSAAIGRVYDAV